MSRIGYFLLIICSWLYGGDFQKNLQEPIPEWMEHQIARSLSHFDHQLSKKYLDHLFETAPFGGMALVRIRITNGQFSAEVNPEMKKIGATPESTAWTWHGNGLQRLYRQGRLPLERNIDFILSTWDFVKCNACHVPTLSNGIGIYQTHDAIPVNFEPIFVQADCAHYHNILMPTWFTLRTSEELHLNGVDTPEEIEAASLLIPWHDKKELLFFRGQDTDNCMAAIHPRMALQILSSQYPHLIDVKLVGGGGTSDPAYYPLKRHGEYKYLLDTDGTCAANPRNLFLMFTGSVIFKTMSNSHSWYYGAMTPYVHFIPVSNDLSDLMEKLAWARTHDAECHKIAQNAHMLAKKLWHDLSDLYIYHLLEAYGAKQALYYEEEE